DQGDARGALLHASEVRAQEPRHHRRFDADPRSDPGLRRDGGALAAQTLKIGPGGLTMEAIAVAHGAAHPHEEEEYTTTGIPHDKLGMWVFLCSEVMFFTGLIGSYIV